MTCPYQHECGGCDFRDRSYAEQLAWKQRYVQNLLAPFSAAGEPVIASPQQDYYRNKMEFVIARCEGQLRIGQRRKSSFNAVVDIAECPIFSQRAGAVVSSLAAWIASSGCRVYDLLRGGKGLRYITCRHSKSTDQLMVTLAVAGDAGASMEELVCRLHEAGADSVYLCVNDAASDRAIAGELRCAAGKEYINETVNQVSYRIYPKTFFQTNPLGCARLYARVTDALRTVSGPVIDLFCGSGGIALQLAAAGHTVIGIDNVEDNCRCARLNAADNRLDAVRFICSDAQEYLESMRLDGSLRTVQALVVDPPRQGLSKRSRSLLAGSGIPRIVYVSCNPLTLAQDLKALRAAYSIERFVAVDMFPHTRHIETIVELKARDGSECG